MCCIEFERKALVHQPGLLQDFCFMPPQSPLLIRPLSYLSISATPQHTLSSTSCFRVVLNRQLIQRQAFCSWLKIDAKIAELILLVGWRYLICHLASRACLSKLQWITPNTLSFPLVFQQEKVDREIALVEHSPLGNNRPTGQEPRDPHFAEHLQSVLSEMAPLSSCAIAHRKKPLQGLLPGWHPQKIAGSSGSFHIPLLTPVRKPLCYPLCHYHFTNSVTRSLVLSPIPHAYEFCTFNSSLLQLLKLGVWLLIFSRVVIGRVTSVKPGFGFACSSRVVFHIPTPVPALSHDFHTVPFHQAAQYIPGLKPCQKKNNQYIVFLLACFSSPSLLAFNIPMSRPICSLRKSLFLFSVVFLHSLKFVLNSKSSLVFTNLLGPFPIFCSPSISLSFVSFPFTSLLGLPVSIVVAAASCLLAQNHPTIKGDLKETHSLQFVMNSKSSLVSTNLLVLPVSIVVAAASCLLAHDHPPIKGLPVSIVVAAASCLLAHDHPTIIFFLFTKVLGQTSHAVILQCPPFRQ
ncbi:hypothetical protein VP01_645g4 [Puccinia sorghi]|uniref:Uncharacterized protein n=1 Tax=Puccinia sorghi TaxID=27349 RepID=A0A0L6UFQ7_9BASI|nr:hypothetical protein VP01_645g4 [Puccinia sorghi]